MSDNTEKFMETIKTLDPELYVVKMALIESGVPPMAIVKLIRSLGNIALGTGFGKVSVFIQDRKITQIKGEESVQVNELIIIDGY